MRALLRLRPALFVRVTLALFGALGTGSCASWTALHDYGGWTLYAKPGQEIEPAVYARAIRPAMTAVERELGSFRTDVRVHAWDPDDEDHATGRGTHGVDGQIADIPGLGPARVRAFHLRGSFPFFASGVFLGVAETGTAVHELVHARLEEEDEDVPLWFEEGLATLLGDGILHDGRWVVDGLACWPLRELREETLTDAELEHLLDLSATDDYTPRENLLVHFLGWAIVFDLHRQQPHGSWRTWLATFEQREARLRLERTLDVATEEVWLERLRSEDPGERLAAAKGVWKLRSTAAVDALIAALEIEEHPEVQVGLAINAILCAGEKRLGWRRWSLLRRFAFPALREAQLDDPVEQAAVRAWVQSFRDPIARERGRAFTLFSRLWEE